MKSFPLEIVTPDGEFFNGEAEYIVVRTVSGEVGVMAGHTDYLNALGMGQARVTVDGQVRTGACIGGMISVFGGKVRVVATTFEWAEQIDLDRAKASEAAARAKLKEADLSREEQRLAEARLKRALVRQSVAK